MLPQTSMLGTPLLYRYRITPVYSSFSDPSIPGYLSHEDPEFQFKFQYIIIIIIFNGPLCGLKHSLSTSGLPTSRLCHSMWDQWLTNLSRCRVIQESFRFLLPQISFHHYSHYPLIHSHSLSCAHVVVLQNLSIGTLVYHGPLLWRSTSFIPDLAVRGTRLQNNYVKLREPTGEI